MNTPLDYIYRLSATVRHCSATSGHNQNYWDVLTTVGQGKELKVFLFLIYYI